MEYNIKICSIYKWYKNPIKWFNDRKYIKIMNILSNNWYNDGGKRKLNKMMVDCIISGKTIIYNNKEYEIQKGNICSDTK